MSLHIYPDPLHAPQHVAQEESWTAAIEQLTSLVGAERIMYLRIAMSEPSGAPLSAPTTPTLSLKADNGDLVALTDPKEKTWPICSIYKAPGHDPLHYVADAYAEPDPDCPTVFKITVTFYDPPGLPSRDYAWQLSIHNNDDAVRCFTWVVAESEAETKQPWLALPPGLDFNQALEFIPVGVSVQAPVAMCNRGTGPLVIDQLELMPVDGTGFTVDTPLPEPIAPSCQDALAFRFTPIVAGVHQTACILASNDSLANPELPLPPHNNRIELWATVAGIKELTVPGGRQGDEQTKAAIAGYSLSKTHAVVFSGRGVTAQLDNTTPVTDTQVPILITIAAHADVGEHLFTVQTEHGELTSSSVAFTVAPRSITTILEPMGRQGDENLNVLLGGEGLAGAISVDFLLNGDPDSKVTAAVDTQQAADNQVPIIITIAQDAALGERTMRLTGAGWHIDSNLPFTVAPRSVIGISTEKGCQGDTARIATVMGQGLEWATEVTFLLNDLADLAIQAAVDTQQVTDQQVPVKINIAQDAALGERTIRLTGPGWRVNSGVKFSVAKLHIAAIEPNWGSRDDTISCKIRGENLAGAETVTFSGTGVTGLASPGGNDTAVPVTVTIDRYAPLDPPRTFQVQTHLGSRADSGRAVRFDIRLHSIETTGDMLVIYSAQRELIETKVARFHDKGYMGQVDHAYTPESDLYQKVVTMIMAGIIPDVIVAARNYPFPANMHIDKTQVKINDATFYVYAAAKTLQDKPQAAAFYHFLCEVA